MCLALRGHLIHFARSRPRPITKRNRGGQGAVKEPAGSVTDSQQVVGSVSATSLVRPVCLWEVRVLCSCTEGRLR
jgi:hypothetical protein